MLFRPLQSILKPSHPLLTASRRHSSQVSFAAPPSPCSDILRLTSHLPPILFVRPQRRLFSRWRIRSPPREPDWLISFVQLSSLGLYETTKLSLLSLPSHLPPSKKKNHAFHTVGPASTVGSVLGGARGITTLLWEGSVLEAERGM